MRRTMISLAILPLSGCALGTVVDVATAPVRVAGKAVDLATTSQSEADEQRGRALRQDEERYGALARKHERAAARCRDGDKESCTRAAAIARDMAELRSRIPAGSAAEQD